jgi:hypothetical protein
VGCISCLSKRPAGGGWLRSSPWTVLCAVIRYRIYL